MPLTISHNSTAGRSYLIREGKAYICELNAEQMREYRGTLTEVGKNSPYRERPAEESLELLEQMKIGAVDEGTMTLRAKIDMAVAKYQYARSGHVQNQKDGPPPHR